MNFKSNVSQLLIKNIREKARSDGIQKEVVGAVVKNGNNVLLLVRKSGDFLENLVELPSGKVKKEEDFLFALRREVEEETGLEVSSINSYIDSFDYISGSGKATRQFNFAVTPSSYEVKINPLEHSDYLWIEIGPKLDDINISKETKQAILRSMTGQLNYDIESKVAQSSD
jgi:8-oxo-dGTP diphosphatase